VLQGMPPEFLLPFSDYLNTISGLSVLPIRNNVPLLGGRCYIGTNDSLLRITSENGNHSLWTETGVPHLCKERRSFDLLLCSIADTFPDRILVVLLSGADVGDLDGLQRIRERSGQIIVQELDSCLAPQHLQEAAQARLVDFEGNHDEIAKSILQYSMMSSAQGLPFALERGDR